MKLDATLHRYLEPDHYRVLIGVEVGSRNHEIVPLDLISTVSNIRPGIVFKILSILSKHGLVNKSNTPTGSGDPGYMLAYGGYDYLALHAFAQRGHLSLIGHQIGVGKESDIYCGQTAEKRNVIVKLERLGRTSFRQIRNTRDYFGTGKKASRAASWLYLSRKAAEREWTFMNALWKRGFPIPEPLSWNRHGIVMERIINGITLDRIHNHFHDSNQNQEEESNETIKETEPEIQSNNQENQIENQETDPETDSDNQIEINENNFDRNHVPQAYEECMNLIIRLAQLGLIHSDFNEFNTMWDIERKHVWMIDFPQMVSIDHPNAFELFQRDVDCIKIFFRRRFKYESEMPIPELKEIVRIEYLDVEIKASGFDRSKKSFLSSSLSPIQDDQNKDDEMENDQNLGNIDSDANSNSNSNKIE